MKINKAELQKALEVVKPGLANKELIEQSTSFAFIKNRVITYNDEISISYPVKNIDLEGAIKADELYQLLSKIKKEEVELETEKDKILLRTGRATAEFTLQNEIKLPLEDIGEIKGWQPLPDDFIKNLRFTVPCAGKDMSRPVLTCLHITKKGIIEASDSHRISQCKGSKMPVSTFLLPASSAVNVIQFSPTDVAEGDGWVHFQNKEGAVLSCRIFEDKYPDTTVYIEQAKKGIEIEFPKQIIDVLDRAMVFSKRDHYLDEMIKVSMKKGRIRIESEGEGSKYEEVVKTENKEDEAEFSITPYIFQDILKQTQKAWLQEDKISFVGDNWIYLGMLRAK